MSLNVVILVGRLCSDPELSFTNTNKAVCKLRMAVDGPYAGQDGRRESVFVSVTVWNKQGQNCANYLAKGRMIAVEGKLNIRQYEAKDGSGKRSVTEVVADTVRFLEKPKEGQEKTTVDYEKDEFDFSDFGTEVDPGSMPF